MACTKLKGAYGYSCQVLLYEIIYYWLSNLVTFFLAPLVLMFTVICSLLLGLYKALQLVVPI